MFLDRIKSRVRLSWSYQAAKIMNESFHELTDSQWQVIQQILDDQRQRWHSLRTVCNAILWINYTGLCTRKNRWPVERSFGWLNFRRRLFREVEKTIDSSEAMLRITFISILANRIAK